MVEMNDISQALIKGNAQKVKELVQAKLDEGENPGNIIKKGSSLNVCYRREV